LIISEVVSGIELEVLILVFSPQADCASTLEDHVQLREVLSTLNDGLIGDKYTAVQLRSEITYEFFTTGHVLVDKYVFEFVNEGLVEKLGNEFEPETGLELL